MDTSLRDHSVGRLSPTNASARPHGALSIAAASSSQLATGPAGAITAGRRNGRPTAAHVIAALSLPETPSDQQDARPLPLTELPRLPRDGSMMYGIGRVDASGRVMNCEIARALGWQPGDRLAISMIAKVIIIQTSPDGTLSVPRKPCIVIPASARHRCAITTGEDVLLAAAPGHGVVIVHTMSVLDDMLSAYHAATSPGSSQ